MPLSYLFKVLTTNILLFYKKFCIYSTKLLYKFVVKNVL